ncbi:type II secretion system protein [Coraliomargarita algicola]|uniref:type II secretion system protein n=1 Tax=Coraliomargarita algicola TaxID=3092156 RepID=UPI003CE56AB7
MFNVSPSTFVPRRCQSSQPQTCSSRSAFTLIELLCVIAVVGILATILLPLLSSARVRASSAVSSSNLRSIGVAMQMYMHEHKGYLPGPITNAQFASYSSSLDKGLTYFLGTYLDAPEPTKTSQVLSCFTFPAYLDYDPNMKGPSYFATTSAKINGRTRNPWGYASSDPDKVGSPSQVFYVNDLDSNATMLLTEIDQQSPQVNGSEGWYTKLSPTPLHKSHRNQLFLDGSVRSVETK